MEALLSNELPQNVDEKPRYDLYAYRDEATARVDAYIADKHELYPPGGGMMQVTKEGWSKIFQVTKAYYLSRSEVLAPPNKEHHEVFEEKVWDELCTIISVLLNPFR